MPRPSATVVTRNPFFTRYWPQQAADLGVVIDDQNVVGSVHGAIFRLFWSRWAREK
jgi:hypothetical protein